MDMDIVNTIDSIMYTSIKALTETQTILQLLVAKGIVTREEVQKTRDKVEANSQYGKLLTPLLARMSVNSEDKDQIISDLMQLKMLAPEAMSERDSELLAEMLQLEYKQKDDDRLKKAFLDKLSGKEISNEDRDDLLKVLDEVKSKVSNKASFNKIEEILKSGDNEDE